MGRHVNRAGPAAFAGLVCGRRADLRSMPWEHGHDGSAVGGRAGLLSGLLAPQLLEARVPSASVPVIGVTDRILLVVVLVVVLGGREGAGVNDLGLDLALLRMLLLE